MRSARWMTAVVACAAVATACGSDDAPGSPSTTASTAPASTTTEAPETTTTTVEATTTTQPAGPVDVQVADFPETPLTAPLDQTYGANGAAFDEAAFGLAPDSLTAAWYRAGDRWAVHYRGLDSAGANGKCPGNSIETASGFEYVSNSPYGALACSVFTGLVLPPGSLYLCASTAVVYVSEIPIDAEGTLYGSLEQGLTDGSIQGATSTVVADAAVAPEIDPSSCQVFS